jgi:O-antigen ligase
VVVPVVALGLVEARWVADPPRLWWAKCVEVTTACAFVVAFFYTYTGVLGVHSIVVVDILTFVGAIIGGQLLSYRIISSPRPAPVPATVSVAALLLLAVLFAVLILTDVRWGMVAVFAVIGFLPFATLPFKIGFTPTFLNLAMLAVYFVWVVRIFTRRDRDLVGTSIVAAVLLFLLVAFFAFANGLRFSRPTMTTIRNFAELVLAISFFFLIVNTLRTRRDAEFLARLIMLAGAVAAAIAVVFYVIPSTTTIRILDALGRFGYPGGAGALRYIEDSAENPMRAIGTMVDPNVLGGFMILTIGLTLPQLVNPSPLFRRWIIAGFLAVEGLALYLTYSRGSLAGLAVGLVVIGLLRYRKLLLLAIGGGALLLLLPQAQAYVMHFVEGIQLQDRATLMRLGEYRDALALIGRYPWFGVGFAGSPDADLYVGVSNLYLLMAEIMGLLGVFAFLIVITTYLANLFWAWRRTRAVLPQSVEDARIEALLLGLLAAIVGALVGGIFDHYLFNLVYPHMGVMLWTYVGLGMVLVRLAAAGSASKARSVDA